MSRLLSRAAFRDAVFARDRSRCVACTPGIGAGIPGDAEVAGDGSPLDAHHLLNRHLWIEPGEAGGYFAENGVTLCGPHHLAAEHTQLSPVQLRALAGIPTVLLPRQLAADETYDTWGNPCLPNGTRLRGPLFESEAAQRALQAGGALSLFTHLVKAPRIPQLPWSEHVGTNDARLVDFSGLAGHEVVVTEKLDGENTTLYADTLHARSLAAPHHPSQSKLKAFHATIRPDLPDGWRLCVENCAAEHTIRYDDLDSLFPVTAVWDAQNRCLPWDDTVDIAAMVGLPTAPVLYRGPFDETAIRACYVGRLGTHLQEGYVVRRAAGFGYGEAIRAQAKFVSAAFREALDANAGVHWASKPVTWNRRRVDSPWAA